MKPHYFRQRESDPDDIQLKMAVAQGYVPATCLLGGLTVMSEVKSGRDPCSGCACSRNKCGGRRRDVEEFYDDLQFSDPSVDKLEKNNFVRKNNMQTDADKVRALLGK